MDYNNLNNNVLTMEVNKLKLNPIWTNKSALNNWAFSCLMTEISVYGILKPIVITDDFVVIDGNCRLQIAKELEIEKVPIVFHQDSNLDDLDTANLKPSTLINLLQIFELKYGLKSNSRYNKYTIPRVLIVLRKLICGGGKNVRQLYKFKEIYDKVKKSYPIECVDILEKLDTYEITLEEGLYMMNELDERRTTINFKFESDYRMVA